MDNKKRNFKTGNIIRIYVRDFLTYDEVEVRPKPHLNFIIGPNGSGKSTILCAICICLGGKPSVMGRGTDVAQYVKTGKKFAVIEIELFLENESCNCILKRKFNTSGKNLWYVQGKETPKKAYEARIADLGIQVDNLCQFLPQDQVANFAKMNSKELLKATQKAVGDTSLFEQHEMLCTSGQKMLQHQVQLTKLQEQLELATRKSTQLKNVVDNHEMKLQMEEEIKVLQKHRWWFLYDKKRKLHMELRQQKEKEMQELRSRRAELLPSEQKAESKRLAILELRKLLSKQAVVVKNHQNKGNVSQRESEKQNEMLEEVQRQFRAKQEEEAQRKRELADFQKQLDVLLTQLRNMPDLNEEEVGRSLRELAGKMQLASQDLARLQGKIQESQMEKKATERKMQACHRELSTVQDVTKQRMELLLKRNRDAYNAAKWLETNADKFRAPVYPPICTLINISESKFAKFVEDRISGNDLIAFVCEDKDDMNLFKELMDKQRIRVNIVHSSPVPLSHYKPPIPIDNLRQYGFLTYMLQCLDAPLSVLSYLCRTYNMHAIPVAEKGDYDSVPANLTLFYIGDCRYSKSQSRYDREWSTMISPLREAALLHISLDTSRVKHLDQEIAICQRNIEEMDQTMKTAKEQERQKNVELENWRNEKRILAHRKEERRILEQKIKQKENQITRRQQGATDLQQEEQMMRKEMQKILTMMVQKAGEQRQVQRGLVEGMQEHIKLHSKLRLTQKEARQLETQLGHSKEALANLEETVQQLQVAVGKAKEAAQTALKELYEALGITNYNEIPDKVRAEFQNSDLETTEQKLAEKEAHLSCISSATDDEIREYNKRKAEVAKLTKDLENAKKSAENHQNSLSDIQERWLPRITDLITSISDMFSTFMSRIGCVGEVVLDRAEDEHDYTKYGILIKVRFRDYDRLRELTAQLQSGGERAISTALYLLSLQRLTSVPFRCVDEINQGMDPINERQMLKMLMETEASEQSSQYFFVTPKLLPEVMYNKYVNVMVVFNSSTMLPHSKFSLKRIMRTRREQNNNTIT